MAHYRKINTRIWNDEKFRALSDSAKLCFLFILTHPSLTAVGAMRASIPGLAEELGCSFKTFNKIFEEVRVKGLLRYDQEARFLWFPNFLKYNRPESPNVVKAWVSALDLLPECELKNELIQHIKSFTQGLSEAFSKAFADTFAKAVLNQEREQDIYSPAQEREGGNEFEIFWQQYPRKKSKGHALKAWHKLKPDEFLQRQISEAIDAAKRSEQWRKDKGKFIPYPATWLNAQGWLDDLGDSSPNELRGAI